MVPTRPAPKASRRVCNENNRSIMEQPQPNSEMLLQLVSMKMPYGKYKDRLLCDLPVSYLEWFQRKGWPQGKLGALLMTTYEIKLNGLQHLLKLLNKM